MSLTMYIFINTDLNMKKGRICAQAGHIVHKITAKIIRSSYESNRVTQECINFMKWEKEPTKIVLKATTEQLNILMKMNGAEHFIDSGLGIPDNSLTAVGFYPGTNSIEELVKGYKLL